ncbi:transcriptional regulator [Actinocatenispora comari]|uniref:Transcriptional regulator n=1 Tax=Actinocatenispora comari TaxID=2807577 RepID=A0A8J4EJJ8_9ACTN|nr:transcriptional regulator [Actinocatenispora comari]
MPPGVRELLTGPDAPSVPALFAAELRRYRIEARLTQDELAQRVYCSSGLVSMIETGRRSPNKDFTKRCDEVLGTGGALMRLWPLLTREAYPSWFRPFVQMEATATAIHEFEVQAVPGLLQTADYARTVIGASWPPNSPDETDRQLAARLERQEILDRPSPPLLWAVLDEGVLRRPVGTPDVMRAQLQHLLKMAQRQHIRLQIMPFTAGVHAAMDGSYTVIDLPNREHVVYVEGPGGGRLVITPELVTQLRLRFDALRGLALSPEESSAAVAARLGEL